MKNHAKDHAINGWNLAIYDNGGRSADRYTVIFKDCPEGRGLFACLGMNSEPFHPQGIGMNATAMPGRHLGRRIRFEELPRDCQRAVEMDCKEPRA